MCISSGQNSRNILQSSDKLLIRKSGYEIQMLSSFSAEKNIFTRFVEGNHLLYFLPKDAAFEDWRTGKLFHEGWDDFAPFILEEYSMIGANHGSPAAQRVIMTRHWYTEADIGRKLIDSAGNVFVIVAIESLSSFLIHSEVKMKNGKRFFERQVSAPLYDENVKLATTSITRIQMPQPAGRQLNPHYRHNRYQLQADGATVKDGEIVECSSAELLWDIDLCLPDALLDHISRHPGKAVSPTDPALKSGIHLDIKINFQPNTAYTVSTSGRYNQDFYGSVTFGLLQHYGTIGFDNQEKIVPKLKPYTLLSFRTSSFEVDLSKPWKMYFEDAVSRKFAAADCVDPNDPPTNYIDLFGSGGNREFGIALGYSPTRGITAKNSGRRGDINCVLPQTGKIYPYAINQRSASEGETFELFSYRQYFVPGNSDTISYTHRESDGVCAYIYCFAPGEKTITLPPEFANRDFEVIDGTGKINFPNGNTVSSNGEVVFNAETVSSVTIRLK